MLSIIPKASPRPANAKVQERQIQISDRERGAWAKAINAHFAARFSRDRTARPDRARRKNRRRNPPDFRRRLKLYRVHVQMPAHSVRGRAVQRVAPFTQERLQPRSRARLQQDLRALHSGESREGHGRGIEHGDRGAPLRRAPDRRAQEAQRANRVAAFRAQRRFENEGRKSRLATLGEQAPREPRVVVAHKGLVKRMVRVAGLDQYFARQVRTAGTPRYLLQLSKGPLARPIVARE